MDFTTAYRLPSWHLTAQETVILRTDCNVPTDHGTILDDARLRALIPTLTQLISSGARIIVLTHWGRPKAYDPALSTKQLVAWFNAHNIPMAFCTSEADTDDTPVIMLENIRFLDDSAARTLIAKLSTIGTYFVHDGFSVMHRGDLFNTQLPLQFTREKRSLGISAYQELQLLNTFLTSVKKPILGIFGGAKLSSKIDALEVLSQQLCKSIALLPAACFSVLRAQGATIGTSFDDGTTAERIQRFTQSCAKNQCTLMLPTDLLVTHNNTHTPPYTVAATDKLNSTACGISFGPATTVQLIKEIDEAGAILINGASGFLEHPASLEPFKKILAHCARTKSTHTLIAGGDTYAALKKLGLAAEFPFISLAGGATLDYCASKKLPGLEVLF